MCGIVGISLRNSSKHINLVDFVFENLKKLEYRGYDSCGAVFSNGKSHVKRAKTGHLVHPLTVDNPEQYTSALAHTRWATHGMICDSNCQPINIASMEEFAIAHNGQIENIEQIARCYYTDMSDTYNLAMHIRSIRNSYCSLAKCLESVFRKVKGSNAFVVMSGDKFYAWRTEQELYASQENGLTVSSDVNVFNDLYTILLTPNELHLLNSSISGKRIELKPKPNKIQNSGSQMLSEIFDQTHLVGNHPEWDKLFVDSLKRVNLVGCGSSYNAGMVGKFLLEMADIQCSLHYASNIDNNTSVLKGPTIYISQSGSTKDVLDAVKAIRSNYSALRYPSKWTVALTNSPNSILSQLSGYQYFLDAGLETAVAATKTFTATCLAFARLAEQKTGLRVLYKRPALLKEKEIRECHNLIKKIAAEHKDTRNMLFCGHGMLYAFAREAALKVKEVSYIHAEAILSAELKHGPLALVDDQMPVFFFVSTHSDKLEQTKANIAQVAARGGKIYVVGDSKRDCVPAGVDLYFINAGDTSSLFEAGLNFTVVSQFLAYELAVQKELNPDRPRNLAKSCTVR